jgi:hypothetical protein
MTDALKVVAAATVFGGFMVTHAELSRQLALALGYAPESVRMNKQIYRKGVCEDAENVVVYRAYSAADPRPMWFPFDYRDPSVVVPLIKWLLIERGATVEAMLPERKQSGVWLRGLHWRWCDTLEEAVARAVIAVGVKP